MKRTRKVSVRFFPSTRRERIHKVYARMRGCGDRFVRRACRIECVPAETSPAWTDWYGCEWHWVRQPEHKGRHEFLHHRFGDRRNTRTGAGGLRESDGVRSQKELDPI